MTALGPCEAFGAEDARHVGVRGVGGVGAGEDEPLDGAVRPAPDALDVDRGVEDQRGVRREKLAQDERLQRNQAEGLLEEIDDVRPRSPDGLDSPLR